MEGTESNLSQTDDEDSTGGSNNENDNKLTLKKNQVSAGYDLKRIPYTS